MTENQGFVLLAEYNQWMNSKTYEACATLSEHDLHLDRNAFFGSIFLTLNHIMCIDLALLSRLTGDPGEAPGLEERLATTFADLRSKREDLDTRIIDWASSLEASWLAAEQTFQSKVDGKSRTVPRWALVTQMFNHQTHHRGQVTTLLSQAGVDVGSTDIPFMPRFVAS